MDINIMAGPGRRTAYVRPQTGPEQTKERLAAYANSRDVATISAQAREAIKKQEPRVNAAASINAVSEGQAGGATFTSFAEEFNKITEGYADTIRGYYAAEHEENLTYDNPGAHVWDKYKNPESPCFRSDLSEDERAWAYDYELELLRGGKHLQIRNPYAFADSGDPPTLADAAMRAIQACREQISRSIQSIFAQSGIEIPASFRLAVDPSNYSIHVTGLEDEELTETIERALNRGDNGKNLYNYLKLASPDGGESGVDCVDGYLPAVAPQQELDDGTLSEVKNQTCPAWARYTDYNPHFNPMLSEDIISLHPRENPETQEEKDRRNAAFRMNMADLIAQVRAMPKPNLQMNWWAEIGEEIGMAGNEVYQIVSETYMRAYFEYGRNAEKTIESYYAKNMEETMAYANLMARKNQTDPIQEALNYLALKYSLPPSMSSHPEFFRWDMSEEERRTAYKQERSLLLLGRVATLYDPYALASVGGLVTSEDSHKYAVQAVKDKLAELRGAENSTAGQYGAAAENRA